MALRHYLHLDAGNAGAVVHAHIAADAAGVLAGTLHHVGLAGVQALAIADGHHLIFIVRQGRHGRVFIAHLVYLVGNGLSPLGGARHATIDAEVIDHASVHGPRQHHAALSRLGVSHLVDAACALMVEVGQCRRVDADCRRLRDNGAAGQLPAGAEGCQQARTGHADDRHGVAAAVLLPLTRHAGVHTNYHGVLVGDVAAVLRHLLEVVGREAAVGVGPTENLVILTIFPIPIVHAIVLGANLSRTALIHTRLM